MSIGFPLATTTLNTRFVASFYLAGATGLIASAAARRAVDTRIFVVGFVAVTALLLTATVWYWSTYTAGRHPLPVDDVLRARADRGRRDPVAPRSAPARPARAAPLQCGVHRPRPRSSPCSASCWRPRPASRCGCGRGRSRPCSRAPTRRSSSPSRWGPALAADERRPQAVRPFALASLVLVATTAAVSLDPPRQVRRRAVDVGLGGGARRRPGRIRRRERRVAAHRVEAGVRPTLRPYMAILGADAPGPGARVVGA